ncbi:MAG: hypothetical protein Tsb002_15720 [Wenzhouxiangellaceae bacterium]
MTQAAVDRVGNGVGLVVPVGAVISYAGELTPRDVTDVSLGQRGLESLGWMLCDGRKLQVEEYPELYSVIGYRYGGSDGWFNIPDLRAHPMQGLSYIIRCN